MRADGVVIQARQVCGSSLEFLMDKVDGSFSTVFILTVLDLVEVAGCADVARGMMRLGRSEAETAAVYSVQ